MLRSLLGALSAALFFSVASSAPVTAATLNLAVNPSVGFSLSGDVEIFDDGSALSIVNGSGATLGGFGLAGLTVNAFDLFVTGDSLATASPMLSFFIDGTDGSLAGDLADFALSANLVELLFDVTQDDFGQFGAQVLMVVSGDFSAGLNLSDASVTINPVAPIPLPATLPLLAAALVVAGVIRRRHSA